MSLASDPDFASRSVAQIKELRGRLAALEKQAGASHGSRAEIEQVKEELGPIRELTEKFGASVDKNEISMLARELDIAAGRGDARTALRINRNLQALKWRVLFSQDWYWKNNFEALNAPGRKFANSHEAQKWLAAGSEAIRKGDSSSLQEAVKHLWQLQPKSDVELDRERVMQSGLRSF